MGTIIGIDLGTTTSEIAYLKNGKPEIIVNKLGERITPSVVNFKNGELIVGTHAKKNSIIDPKNSILEVKRLMGTDAKINLMGKEYSPIEVSAMILKDLKHSAEEFLGEKITKAVITVPANFNDLERNATKKAGELAGLKVERVINEPTAAAIAYGINNMEMDAKILVYDLGGGTFDVTVLEFFDGIIDVKSSRGNNKLGGKDFDDKLILYIVSKIKIHYDIDIRANKRAMARVKEVAEEAKKALSIMETTEISLPYLAMKEDGEPLDVDLIINRVEFNNLIKGLVREAEETIMEALAAANYEKDDIDAVILVGGSTRVPLIRESISEIFGSKIKSDINPDEAVALGAAVQGAIENDDISSENGIIVTDTCSFSMGIAVSIDLPSGEVVNGVYSPIIKRDTKIPCIEKDIYNTACDNQESVVINIFQGENKYVEDNIFIGSFALVGIPKAPKGEEKIEVQFTYNLNGILEVKGTVLSNGKKVEGILDTGKIYGEKNNDYISIEELPLYSLIKETLELVEARRNRLSEDSLNKIDQLIDMVKLAIRDDDEIAVKKIDEKITNLLFGL